MAPGEQLEQEGPQDLKESKANRGHRDHVEYRASKDHRDLRESSVRPAPPR